MLKMLQKTAVIAITALAAAGVSAETRLQGGGATFPNPIYQKWIGEFAKTHDQTKLDYQSIGSGGGIKGITDKTFDFAGSDAPMSKAEITAAKDEVIHIPTVAGAVVLAYNLPGVTGDLKLTGPIIADIYLGKIKTWNDKAIADVNAGTTLPALGITPAYRTDGSGTNFVFTSYLSTQSDEFKGKIGAAKQVQWPVGQGGKGNEGVTQAVQQTPGAIGFIEVNYATANHIPFALVQNKNGKFIKASPKTISAAGEGAAPSMKPDSLAVSLWDQSGDESYPVSAFTYILVYKNLDYLKDPAKAKALVEFLTWAVSDGQKLAESMDYAPLSDTVQKRALEAIHSLTWDGKAVAMSN